MAVGSRSRSTRTTTPAAGRVEGMEHASRLLPLLLGAVSSVCGFLYLHRSRGFPPDHSVILGLYYTSLGYVLLGGSTPEKRKALVDVQWVSWLLRLLLVALVGFGPPNERYRAMFEGRVWPVMGAANELMAQVVTCDIRLKWRTVMGVAFTYMWDMWAFKFGVTRNWWALVVVSELLLLALCGTLAVFQVPLVRQRLNRVMGRTRGHSPPGAQHSPQQQQSAKAHHGKLAACSNDECDMLHDAAKDSKSAGLEEPAAAGRHTTVCSSCIEDLHPELEASAANGSTLEAKGDAVTPLEAVVGQQDGAGQDLLPAPVAGEMAAAPTPPASTTSAATTRRTSKVPWAVARQGYQSIAALARQIRQAEYTSSLASSQKVCLKLGTSLPTSVLPPDMAHHMQAALNLGGPTIRVSQFAVRTGCIMITLDAHSEEAFVAYYGRTAAQALLDKVQAVLGRLGSEGQPPVQQATVQLGSRLFTGVWNEGGAAWEVQPADSLAGSPNSGASTSSSVSSSSCGEVLGLGAAVSVRASRLWPGAPAAHPQAAHVKLTTEVQVWGMATAKALQGWSPPPAGQHAPNHTWAAPGEGEAAADMKLLARCKGQYLTTQVKGVTASKLQAACAVAEVVVDVPAGLLTTHHPGGPPSAVLLLNLELWRGEVFISETPLLAAPAAAAPATQGQQGADRLSFTPWWWGADGTQVGKALADVQAYAQALSAAAEDDTSGSGHAAGQPHFLQDLALWLQGVQQVASTTSACMSCHSSGLDALTGGSGLTVASLQQLAGDLAKYAEAVGLQGVCDMVTQQAQWVKKQVAPPAWTTCLPFSTSILGFPCRLCEECYTQQIVKLQPFVSMGMVCVGLLLILNFARHSVWGGIPLTMAWSGLHAMNMLYSYRRSSSPAFCAYPYLWRIAYQWFWVLGILPRQVSVEALRIAAPWALWQVGMASEQVQASSTLSAPRLMLFVLFVDLPCVWAKAVQEIKDAWLPVLLAPFVTILPRLLLSQYIRSTMNHRARSSQSQQTCTCTPVAQPADHSSEGTGSAAHNKKLAVGG